MEEIILGDGNIKITQEKTIFKIEFRYTAYNLINSILNTNIIKGGSTDDKYKTINFKASSVKTLKQYQEENYIINGKKNLLVSQAAKMIRSLVLQLNYLIECENCTVLGYNLDDIIVINDEKFAFLRSELIANIDPEGSELAMISCPFSTTDFFVSPELLKIKEIPSFVHYKIAYFSLALLIIYCLLADDEFYTVYLNDTYSGDTYSGKILDSLNNHPVKQTKLYWLLSRCLVEEPKNRSILLI